MNIKVIGIDLAKNNFQVCVMDKDGVILSNRKVTRAKLVSSIQRFEQGNLIAMEACGSANYWARQFESLGYKVKLLPAQHVKALVGHQKNDANDARAICEAAFRPNVHPVQIKTREQQDLKLLVNLRYRYIQRRTQLINTMRGIASEYGEIFPQGKTALLNKLLDCLAESNELSDVAKDVLRAHFQEVQALNVRIRALDKRLEDVAKVDHRYARLQTIPGVGPVTAATAIADIGDAEQFKNGRQLSAWCGLVPKQHTTGGKEKLSGITKNGNRGLRTLMIHCARSVFRLREKHSTALCAWLKALIERRGKARAIVALANKLLRIVWRMLSKKEQFEMSKAFTYQAAM